MITWTTKKSWLAVAVSRIGAAHVQSEIPCQDASRCFVDSDTLIACVADGAGSARHSDKGARAAVDRFIDASRDSLKDGDAKNLTDVVLHAFEESRQAVLKVAGDNPREYATTLLAVVATGKSLTAIQVGDGAIVIDGDVVMDSQSGEYANETKFLTQSEVEPNTFSVSERARRVALLTDGMENIVLKNNGYQRMPHAPFFDPMYEWLQRTGESDRAAQLGDFLVSEQVRSKTTDDVTLLLAIR